MSNKTKCTPEAREKICRLLKQGNYLETACAAAGVEAQTSRDWMRRGAAEAERRARGEKANANETPYLLFHEESEEAMHFSEASLVGCISRAATKEWPAALAILERRHPLKWSVKVRAEVGSWVKLFVARAEKSLSPEELKKVLAVLEELEVVRAAKK